MLFAILTFAATLRAAGLEPFAGPEPLAVVLETDPWNSVIGSDTPLLALYEDGELVYVGAHGKSARYDRRRLSQNELALAKTKLAALAAAKVERRIDLIMATDQPETYLYARSGNKTAATGVYGLAVRGGLPAPLPQEAANLPPALRETYSFLLSLAAKDGRPWRPKYVEAMLSPFDESKGREIAWPKGWPGLKSTAARARHGSYSVFLPDDQQEKLFALSAAQGDDNFVSVDGKKWSVSARLVFPSEPVWREAFSSN
jgi:hypothetical protein